MGGECSRRSPGLAAGMPPLAAPVPPPLPPPDAGGAALSARALTELQIVFGQPQVCPKKDWGRSNSRV